MSLQQFITEILNIEESSIETIHTLKDSDENLIITLRLKQTNFTCPYCKDSGKVHGYYQRKLKHSTLVNRKCTIIYQQRRYKCPNCNFTFSERNPFANSSSGLTFETKVNILNELKLPTSTYTVTAARFFVSKATVLKLFDKHVNIPRKQLPRVLSIDEHYFPESDRDSLYCCLLMDFETGILIDVLPDRKKAYLTQYFGHIKSSTFNYVTSTSELDNVKFISIDMYDNFRDIAAIYFPNATICADSFHVLQHLTKAFRQVRLRCRRETKDKILFYLLTKFRYVFHHNAYLDNIPRYNKRLGRNINRRDIRDLLFQHFPELRIAYNLKENYIIFNQSSTVCQATKYFDSIAMRFADSGIPEYEEFHSLLLNWKQEILNSFIIINGRRINNSYIESKNSQLEKLIRNANGFRNFERTRKRILYCLNPNETFTL